MSPVPPKPVLALLGRPNVGKSTLFNLMSREGRAVVHNAPGTTRDTRLAAAALGKLNFHLLDTAGMEQGRGETQTGQGHHGKARRGQRSLGKTSAARHNAVQAAQLSGTLTGLAAAAAKRADVLLLIIDGASGPLPADVELARELRKLNKPILALITKADLADAADHTEAVAALGFGTPLLISAEHRLGLSDLEEALAPHCPQPPEPDQDSPSQNPETPKSQNPTSPQEHLQGPPQPAESTPAARPMPVMSASSLPEDPEELPELAPLLPAPIRLAIVGRPNTGKSTLTNALLRHEAMLTGPSAGLTRDAVSHTFVYKDQEIILTDTPGLRKKTKITEKLEQLMVGQTIEAIDKSDIVLLLVDASTYNPAAGKWQLFDEQDTKIAATILNQNKMIVVGLTKWDLVRDKEECLEETNFQLARRMAHIQQPLALPMSALKNKGINKLLDGLLMVHEASRQTISTGKFNRTLAALIAKNPPPSNRAGVTKLKFIRQLMANPPMVGIWGNRVDKLPDFYKTYLRNQLAQAFGWQNVPLKLIFKANKNPYHKKA